MSSRAKTVAQQKPEEKSQACPTCGGVMHYREGEETIKYKGETETVRMLAWWCTNCDEAIFHGAALASRERAFLALRARVDQVLGPDEVAKVRSALKLSQRKAGELLGGGPRAFQKYESGTQAVSAPMSNLLRLLANDPARLRELDPGTAAAAKVRTKA